MGENIMITQEELHELFDYKEDGNLIWKIKNKKLQGGTKNGKIYVTLFDKKYFLHHLIYIYYYGSITKHTRIWHIDENRKNNRIENLCNTKNKPNIIINQDNLRKIFKYKNGQLFFKKRGVGHTLGQRAGYLKKKYKYRVVKIHPKIYFEHILIWIYHYGDIPNGLEIDHINRIRDDNHIENLRLVTNQENKWNRSNVKGYTFSSNKWQSSITVNSKTIHLGTFNTKKEAIDAYLKAKEKYHIIKDRKNEKISNNKKN